MSQTLAFLHTNSALVPMFSQLAKEILPDIKTFHMSDESLIRNTIELKALTKTTIRRTIAAIESAHEGGADMVIVTCSTIGPAVSMARRLVDFPVLRVDEPMAETAVRIGRRVGAAATLGTTLEPTIGLLREKAAEAGRDVEVVPCFCEGAYDAFIKGDLATHDRLLTAALKQWMREMDVVVLAQSSMSRVLGALPKGDGNAPVLTSPESGVRYAAQLLRGL
jgi:Asp/Glu/hydantoin racemase